MTDSIIIEELYPIAAKNLSDKTNVSNAVKYMQGFFDRNSEKLFTVGPTFQVYFTKEDSQIIYDTLGLQPDVITATIKKSEYIKTQWKIMNKPINSAFCAMLRYLEINKMQDELHLSLVYFNMSMYWSLFDKYFKHGVNENIMAYTINNLSNKFLVKQFGTMFKMIQHNAITSHETYKDNLVRGTDGDLANYVNYFINRLNAFMKKIAIEYYANHSDKKYLNLDKDSYEEGNFHMTDNDSFATKRVIDKTMIRLSTYGPNMQYVRLSANWNNVSEIVFRNAILNIVNNDSDSIKEMISLMIELYLSNPKNKADEIHTKKFIVESLDVYKKSNTNDVMILKIKELLDKWLTESSEKYARTQRDATLSYYRKALFTFFVLTIQDNSTD